MISKGIISTDRSIWPHSAAIVAACCQFSSYIQSFKAYLVKSPAHIVSNDMINKEHSLWHLRETVQWNLYKGHLEKPESSSSRQVICGQLTQVLLSRGNLCYRPHLLYSIKCYLGG